MGRAVKCTGAPHPEAHTCGLSCPGECRVSRKPVITSADCQQSSFHVSASTWQTKNRRKLSQTGKSFYKNPTATKTQNKHKNNNNKNLQLTQYMMVN